MVRAKFRVMSVTVNRTGQVDVACKPVIYTKKKGSHDVYGCEENAAFWEATPAGDLTFCLPKGSPAIHHFIEGGDLQPDQAFYLDFTPAGG